MCCIVSCGDKKPELIGERKAFITDLIKQKIILGK